MSYHTFQEAVNAIKQRNIEALSAFVSAPTFDKYEVDIEGRTLLTIAVVESNKEAIAYLLDKGCFDIHMPGQSYQALAAAVSLGDTNILKMLFHYDIEVNAKENGSEPILFIAARKGNADIIKLLVQHGADINIDFPQHKLHFFGAPNILSWAVAYYADVEMVEFLLQLGADTHKTDEIGSTALFWAITAGKPYDSNVIIRDDSPSSTARKESIVKLLLQYGATLNHKDYEGNTVLHWAVREGDEVIIKLLLDNGADVKEKNNKGDTPLHWAVREGSTDTVSLLLQYGADIDTKCIVNETAFFISKCDETALFIAARAGDMIMVEFLLKHGADVHTKSFLGQTALFVASNEEIAELLLKYGARVNEKALFGYTALDAAIYAGKIAVVKTLLTHGAEVNGNAHCWETPLIKAVEVENIKIIELLLQYGARINDHNIVNKTPLLVAIEQKNKEIIELLLKNGASLNKEENDSEWSSFFGWVRSLISEEDKAINQNDHNPLVTAIKTGDTDLVKFLVKLGANVIITHSSDIPSMHFAAAYGNVAMLEFLQEQGADIHAKDQKGNTALFFAASAGNKETVSWLLEHDIDINAKNNAGKTALFEAVRQADSGVVELLLRTVL